jgi:hypothetical protein
MSYPISVSQWREVVSRRFPQLSKPQAVGLASYSLGIVLADGCGQSRVAQCLGNLEGQSWQTTRQRLREWRNEAKAKKGEHRQELEVSHCFAHLLRWVLSCMPDDQQPLVLALDASSFSDRFVVLSISVMVRSCAIPVAWHIRPARAKGSWKPIWLHLLDLLHEAVPTERSVLVMTDRGLYARWLYRRVQQSHWHPFMRINVGVKARPEGCKRGTVFEPVRRLVPHVGSQWSGKVTCFSGKDRRQHATLLARWEPGYKDPWIILTDLAPEQAQSGWYGLRSWIECGFKDFKGGGWHWTWSRITDAGRMERLWLAMAVASLLVLVMGAQQEVQESHGTLDHLPATHIARRNAQAAKERREAAQEAAKAKGEPEPRWSGHPKRELSCFLRGCLLLLARLSCFEALGPFLLPMEPLPSLPPLPIAGGFWGTG